MSTVFEIASRYVVPSIRREAVLELLRKGFSKVEVSRALGISKSLVSRYAKGERGKLLEVGHHPVVRNAVDKIAYLVESGEVSEHKIEEEIVKAVVKLLSAKALCGFHEKLDRRFNPTVCQICVRVFSKQQ
ncbi:MAG: hypothetical protein QXY48_00750 [Sulfolobales archaeon]